MSGLLSFIARRPLRKQGVELRHGPRPEGLVPTNPGASFIEGRLPQTKTVYAPFDPALDQTGLLQDLQMFRNRRLGRAELTAQFARAAGLALAQRIDHRSARAVSERVEGSIEARNTLHSHMAIQSR